LARHSRSIPARAGLALLVAASAAAGVRAQSLSNEFELRPTIGQGAQRAVRTAQQQPTYASPPG
jgi:hypothetical protein